MACFARLAAHVSPQVARQLRKGSVAPAPSSVLLGRGRNLGPQLAAGAIANIPDRRNISKASDPDDDRAAAIVSGLDLGHWSDVEDAIADTTAEVYADGYTAGSRLISVGVSTDQVNARSVVWARHHAAELVRDLEDNTRDMLRGTVADAIEEGWGADELAREIEDGPGFNRARAENIARTEVIAANNRGNLDSYQDNDDIVYGKEWLTSHDDLVEEICEENEAVGPIGLYDDFPSGDDCAPAHGRCRCAVIPVLEPIE